MVFLLQLFALYPELVDRSLLDSFEVATYIPEELVEVRVVTDVRHPAYGQAGLYAKRTIPGNTIVTPYAGFIEIFNTSCNSRTYTMGFGSANDDYALDAEFAGNFGRYANDPRGVEGLNANLGAESRFNARGESFTALVARRQIYEGEEILMSYGKAHSLSSSAWMNEQGRPLARPRRGGVLPCPQIAAPTTTDGRSSSHSPAPAAYRLMWECSQCGKWNECEPTMHDISYCAGCGTPKLSGVKMVHMLHCPSATDEEKGGDGRSSLDATTAAAPMGGANHDRRPDDTGDEHALDNSNISSNSSSGGKELTSVGAAAGVSEAPHDTEGDDQSAHSAANRCEAADSRIMANHTVPHANKSNSSNDNNNNNNNTSNNTSSLQYSSVRVDWPLNVPFVPWQIWDPAVPFSALTKNSRFDTHEHVFLYNVHQETDTLELTHGKQSALHGVSQRRQKAFGTVGRRDGCEQDNSHSHVKASHSAAAAAAAMTKVHAHDASAHDTAESQDTMHADVPDKCRTEDEVSRSGSTTSPPHPHEKTKRGSEEGDESLCTIHSSSFSDLLFHVYGAADTGDARTCRANSHKRERGEQGAVVPVSASTSTPSARPKSDELWAKHDSLSKEEACYIDSRRAALSTHHSVAASSAATNARLAAAVTPCATGTCHEHGALCPARTKTQQQQQQHNEERTCNESADDMRVHSACGCCCAGAQKQAHGSHECGTDSHATPHMERSMSLAHVPRLSDILPLTHEVDRLIRLTPHATAAGSCSRAGHMGESERVVAGSGETADLMECGPVRVVQRILSSLTRRIFAGIAFQPGEVVANVGGVLRYRHDTRCRPDNSTLIVPMKYMLPRAWRQRQRGACSRLAAATSAALALGEEASATAARADDDDRRRNAQDFAYTLSMLELVVTNEMMYCPCLLLLDAEDSEGGEVRVERGGCVHNNNNNHTVAVSRRS